MFIWLAGRLPDISKQAGVYTLFTPYVYVTDGLVWASPAPVCLTEWGRRRHGRGQALEVTVAIRALERRALVDHDLFAFDNPGLLVALVARHVGVATGKWQAGFVMVEDRWLPSRHVVAVGAMRGVVLGGELPIVRVLMAGFTFLRSAFETSFGRCCRLVAIRARHGAVRTQEREFRLRVIVSVDVAP